MYLLPQTTEYALRAIIQIAKHHPQSVGVQAIAAAVGAPANYLAKTLSQMARAGVLLSSRGPNGGFRLADDPARLTLDRVVAVFRDTRGPRCLLGAGPCGSNHTCPVHHRWKPVQEHVSAFFASTTVADLVSGRRPAPFPSSRPPVPPRSSRAI